MARRSLDEALDQYASGGSGGEFFKLVDDKDSSVVRILHEGDDFEFDEDWFIVHKLEIDGKERWIRCPETSSCPCCKELGKPTVRLIIQLIEKNDSGVRKIWERGKTSVPKLKGLIAKYGDLCNRPYEIERHGKAKDTKTTYEFYPMDRDDKRLSDISIERQKLLDGKNGYILDLSDDEMWDAIDGKLKLKADSDSSRERGRDNGRDRGGRESRNGSERSDRGRDSDSGRSERSSGREESRERDRGSRDEPERRREGKSTDIF